MFHSRQNSKTFDVLHAFLSFINCCKVIWSQKQSSFLAHPVNRCSEYCNCCHCCRRKGRTVTSKCGLNKHENSVAYLWEICTKYNWMSTVPCVRYQEGMECSVWRWASQLPTQAHCQVHWVLWRWKSASNWEQWETAAYLWSQ